LCLEVGLAATEGIGTGAGPFEMAMSTVEWYGAEVALNTLSYDQLMTWPVGTVLL